VTPARQKAIVTIEELLAELPRHARRCALEAPGYPTGPCNCDGNRGVRARAHATLLELHGGGAT
jgi:hypothetical protein